MHLKTIETEFPECFAELMTDDPSRLVRADFLNDIRTLQRTKSLYNKLGRMVIAEFGMPVEGDRVVDLTGNVLPHYRFATDLLSGPVEGTDYSITAELGTGITSMSDRPWIQRRRGSFDREDGIVLSLFKGPDDGYDRATFAFYPEHFERDSGSLTVTTQDLRNLERAQRFMKRKLEEGYPNNYHKALHEFEKALALG